MARGRIIQALLDNPDKRASEIARMFDMDRNYVAQLKRLLDLCPDGYRPQWNTNVLQVVERTFRIEPVPVIQNTALILPLHQCEQFLTSATGHIITMQAFRRHIPPNFPRGFEHNAAVIARIKEVASGERPRAKLDSLLLERIRGFEA